MTIAVLSDQNEIQQQEKLERGETGDALNLVSVFDQVLFRAVTEAGQLLVLPRALGDIFDEVLRIVEQVIPVRRILLLSTQGPDEPPVVQAARPARAAEGGKLVLSQSLVSAVLTERQAMLLNDTFDDPRFRGRESIIQQRIRSALVAPLFDNNEVIGLLYADNDDPRFRYDRNQLRAFTLLANLIAVKITNTRLLEAEREKERIEQQIDAAVVVQQGLLSTVQVPVPGYEIVARQVPCYEVAGDLYDVTPLHDGRIALVVGDVTGKGLGAAMLMSNAIAALRVLYQEYRDATSLAGRLHRQIWRSSGEIHFVTLFLGLLDPRTHQLEYVNAGHNPPFLICSETEHKTLGPTGMPLGLIEGATYRSEVVDLPSCCLFCVFTDGMTEAMVRDVFYGEERLLASIRKRCHVPLNEIFDGMMGDLRAFLGEHMLQDDVTALLLRRQS
jgi:sigma-B regulation protein RsbU (phosphoserine phosphatase)